MTSKTTKTIFFASIIGALIISMSAITVDALQTTSYDAEAEIAEIEKYGIPLFDAKKELGDLSHVVSDPIEVAKLTTDEVQQIEDRMTDLETLIQKNEAILEQMDKERIIRFTLDPVLETSLRENQKLALESDLPIISTSVSHSQKSLEIMIDETKLTESKDMAFYTNAVKAEFGDIPLIISFGSNYNESCTSADANCNPIVGGIQMEGKNHGPCSIGLPVTRSGVDGWITAAHCVNTGSGSANDVYQPTEDWFGWNKVGDTTVRVYAEECDCAFVDQSSSDDTEESVWRSSNNYLSITGYIDRASNGSTVVYFGAEDNSIHFGVVDDNTATMTVDSIDFDGIVLTTDISEPGDSGGAVTDGGGDDFLGIHKGISSGDSFFIPWENIEDELGL